MSKDYPEVGSWAPINVGGYNTSHVGGPAHAEANQPKEAKGNSKAHEKSVRESGHKEMRKEVGEPLYHDERDKSPHSVPPIHRDSKGLDVTNAAEKHHAEYATTKGEERDWTTGGKG